MKRPPGIPKEPNLRDFDLPGYKRPVLNEEMADTIAALIEAGATPRLAAESIGVPYPFLRAWLDRGEGRGAEPATKKYVEFAFKIRQAIANRVVRYVRLVAEAANDQPGVAMWMLERVAPDEFGRRLTVAGDEEKPITIGLNIRRHVITRDGVKDDESTNNAGAPADVGGPARDDRRAGPVPVRGDGNEGR